jgi:hypothetical protein
LTGLALITLACRNIFDMHRRGRRALLACRHRPHLVELAERGCSDGVAPRIRVRAKLLAEALGDLAATSRSFHGAEGEAASDLLEAYARDHQR